VHRLDATAFCFGCGAAEPWGAPPRLCLAVVDDSLPRAPRFLCIDCRASAVRDAKEAAPVWEEVRAFFVRLGLWGAEEPLPPLEVADGATMLARRSESFSAHEDAEEEGVGAEEEAEERRARAGAEDSFSRRLERLHKLVRAARARKRHHGAPRSGAEPPLPLGLCISQMRSARAPPGGARAACAASSVLLLHSQPYLMAGMTLAHELCHAALAARADTPVLERRTEEGLCEALALLWLSDRLEKGPTRGEERLEELPPSALAYGAHRAEAALQNPSRVYGGGCRATMLAVRLLGLEAVLAALRAEGCLPLLPPWAGAGSRLAELRRRAEEGRPVSPTEALLGWRRRWPEESPDAGAPWQPRRLRGIAEAAVTDGQNCWFHDWQEGGERERVAWLDDESGGEAAEAEAEADAESDSPASPASAAHTRRQLLLMEAAVSIVMQPEGSSAHRRSARRRLPAEQESPSSPPPSPEPVPTRRQSLLLEAAAAIVLQPGATPRAASHQQLLMREAEAFILTL